MQDKRCPRSLQPLHLHFFSAGFDCDPMEFKFKFKFNLNYTSPLRPVGGDRDLDKLAATHINQAKKNLAIHREAYVSVCSL